MNYYIIQSTRKQLICSEKYNKLVLFIQLDLVHQNAFIPLLNYILLRTLRDGKFTDGYTVEDIRFLLFLY